jgi:DNA-binding transcriptional LysR family regulator
VRLFDRDRRPVALTPAGAALLPRTRAWIEPSHAQAARVADGSLDLAVCWVRTQDLEQYGLSARLTGTDRLYAVAAGDDTSDVHASDAAVLLDDDTTSWASWNLYAGQLARDTGAHVVRICDGGITGPAFFDHVRHSRRPIVNSPKGQTAPPSWPQCTALTDGVGDLGIHRPDAWLTDSDPHKQ